MTTFLLIAMALLLIAVLERTHRRQSQRAPGLHGSHDHNDRDWARTKLDLLALGAQAEPFAHKPFVFKGHLQTRAPGIQHTPKPAQPGWNTNHRKGPRAA
jgi:hypothetical protein